MESLHALLTVLSELPALRRLSFGGCFSEMLSKDVQVMLAFAALVRQRNEVELVDMDVPRISHFGNSI